MPVWVYVCAFLCSPDMHLQTDVHENLGKQSPYLNAFSMLPATKRSSSSTSLKSTRSAPSTPQHRRRAQTPSGARESGAQFTLEFNGGLRGASYRLAIKQQPAGAFSLYQSSWLWDQKECPNRMMRTVNMLSIRDSPLGISFSASSRTKNSSRMIFR